ncbi:MAG: alpha/beta fold hydrolase [Actinomycetota bacterium]|nr:alpha/beta fold hydrolase [Actinomycetota bacterium]
MDRVEVHGLSVAYRAMGTGAPVLLLHGWPTSSYLWRDVMAPIAEHNTVIAPDLPGFGRSSKPLDGYEFEFFDQVLDGFLDALGITEVALAAHDLGGPIALHWALHRQDRLSRLALLNTVAYPEFHPSAIAFVRGLVTPSRRAAMTSPEGLEQLMRQGVANPAALGEEVISAVQAPFDSEPARLALAAAGVGLRASGFKEIARLLPTLQAPVRIVYGAQDRLLPDIAETVARLRIDLPQAEVTELPDAGHFIQEDAPAQVGMHLARFFAASAS